jgi:hypothetical protein
MLTKEKGGLRLHAAGSFFDPKNGGHVFPRNLSPLPSSTALQRRRLYSSEGYNFRTYVFEHKKEVEIELYI